MSEDTPVVESVQATTATTETTGTTVTPVETKVEPKKEIVSPKLAAAAIKEKELRATQRELAQIKRELEVRAQRVIDAEALSKMAPLDVLNKLNIDPDKMAEALLTGNKHSTPHDEITKLRREIEQERAQRAQMEAQRAEQMRQTKINNWENSVINTVRSDPDKYELTNLNNAQSLAPQTILAWYEEHGEELTVEQAAEKVESYYEDLAKKVSETKKFKSKFSKSESKTEKSTDTISTAQSVAHQDARSISNSATISAASTHNANQVTSDAEDRAAALRILRGDG